VKTDLIILAAGLAAAVLLVLYANRIRKHGRNCPCRACFRRNVKHAQWCDATWNCVTGCTKVSPGCDRCYAETFAERWRGTPGHHFEQGFDVRLWPDRLSIPLHWRRPRRIFVNSMSDLFHEAVPDEFLHRVFAVMAMASQHTFLILTKRHGRLRSFLRDECKCGKGHAPGIHLRSAMDWAGTPHSPTYVPGVIGREVYYDRPWPLPNVWIGISAEDQKWANIRIPALIDTPAAVRWVSAEPLLGPVDLSMADWTPPEAAGFPGVHNPLTGEWWPAVGNASEEYENRIIDLPGIDWVVAGGESGPRARPCDLEWLRSLRDQCADARVPYFCKQLGAVLGRELGAGPKGGDWDAWPDDLKVRKFPHVPETVNA
jgi:protein gp37